ncbi:MAG: dihydrolipoyl dehydrogenase [Pseudomonadota bacterium]|nr:dihydrolipoyl dehydrogenase [Pseudomonadota bacterium]
MTNALTIEIPDIGDVESVDVVEIMVSVGEHVEIESPLVTLESDKASMDLPSTAAGRVTEILVQVGDSVSQGTPVIVLQAASSGEAAETTVQPAPLPEVDNDAVVTNEQTADFEVDLVVIGSGPGGYTAAFRAADLGLKTALVEQYPVLGGVCLNVGCIPSKALLHAARVVTEAEEMRAFGIDFGHPTIDVDRLQQWKQQVVGQLTTGLGGLAQQRKVTLIQGKGRFASSHRVIVDNGNTESTVDFKQAIIAVGSHPTMLPDLPDDQRIVDSTGALALAEIPQRLLVIGGGIIGLEMATVYAALGSDVTIVEMLDRLMPGTDPDLVRPLERCLKNQVSDIFLSTRVQAISPADDGLVVSFDGEKAPEQQHFDCVLVAIGRRPNGMTIDAKRAGISVDDDGFISVDRQQRTNVANIFAIGDVVGQPMLAHKATHEGKVAAEVAAGQASAFDSTLIPSVAYTDPEVAWVGLTEETAKAQSIAYEKGTFPWAASGRALGIGRSEGITKLLFDPDSHRILGAGIVGSNAGELIAEVTLAIEMGCEAGDLGLTIHPHPTLSETVALAAEAFEGTITDLYLPRKKKS